MLTSHCQQTRPEDISCVPTLLCSRSARINEAPAQENAAKLPSSEKEAARAVDFMSRQLKAWDLETVGPQGTW